MGLRRDRTARHVPVGKDVSLEAGMVVGLLHRRHERERPHGRRNGRVGRPCDGAVQLHTVEKLVPK